MKNSPTSFIPDSLLSSPSSHLSRSAQRRYHTHTLPHLAPPHSPIDTTPTLYIQPTSPTLSLTITTNSPTPATTVSTAAAAGITDSTAATAGKDEEGRYKQPSEVRHTELSQHTPTLNIQHTTKPIDIPQTLSSVSTFPSSPPYQLNPSAPPATTSYPDATGEPTQRGHNAMETSADPAPSLGHKCYATLTSAQKAPQPRHCDDANCPPGGSSSAVGQRESPMDTTESACPAADTEKTDVPPAASEQPHQTATDASTAPTKRSTLSTPLPLSNSPLFSISHPPISTEKSSPPITADDHRLNIITVHSSSSSSYHISSTRNLTRKKQSIRGSSRTSSTSSLSSRPISPTQPSTSNPTHPHSHHIISLGEPPNDT